MVIVYGTAVVAVLFFTHQGQDTHEAIIPMIVAMIFKQYSGCVMGNPLLGTVIGTAMQPILTWHASQTFES